MLVAARMVDAAQVDEALAHQKQSGRRLGELLVELGYVTEVQVAQVLSNQLTIPWANLYHVDFSRELLNLVPAELAEKFNVVPVYVRRLRQQGDTLFVATDDPTNDAALIQIATHAGMPVKPMVAAASDVRNAIRVYYFGGVPREASAPLPRPKPAHPSTIPPVHLEDTETELEEVSIVYEEDDRPSVPEPEPVAAAPRDPSLPPPAAEPAPEAPRRRRKAKGKFVTLTLLDGTKVRLPAPGQEEEEDASAEHALTTRDLVTALLARAQGRDVSRVLADDRWEVLFATLLSILLKKGLVADWEFVDEWNKHRGEKKSS